MKRKNCALLLCSVSLSMLLAACSSSATAPTPTPTLTPPPKVLASSPSPMESPSIVTEPLKEFAVTMDETVKILSDSLATSEYENIFATEPTKNADSGSVAYLYPINDSNSCTLYTNADSEMLTEVFLTGDSSKMDVEDARLFGYYAATITGIFSPSDELDKLDEALNIADSSFSEDSFAFFTGTLASFTYIVDDGVAMLMVTPVI